MSESKVVSLARAAALVADGDHITIGGVMLHRIPTVDFVTATGNLDRVVTPHGVFRATPEGLRLESLRPGAMLEEIARRPGFPIDPLSGRATLAPPTDADMEALAALDPDRPRDLDLR